MELPGGIELEKNQLIIGATVVGVLILIAVPLAMNMQSSAGSGELPLNVEAIRTAEIEYRSAFSEYVAADAAPRSPHAVNDKPVEWKPSTGFSKLSWAPDETLEVYGAYWVEATKDSFTVHGASDLDGDGERAIWKATADAPAAATTADGVR